MWTVAEARARLAGVIGGPVSPFRPDLSLDLAALEENTARMARHPYSALLIAAGIAEFFSLTPEEIGESVAAGVCAAGATPVVGTVAFGLETGRELARRQERAGAAALLVMPPYYTQPPFEGLLAYYRGIGEATGLPLIVYSRDWAVFTPEQVARLAESVPTLAAWKDGQGDMRRYQRIMSLVGDRLAWLGGAGDDAVPGYYAIGVAGYTSSVSNLAPRLPFALVEAAGRGEYARLGRLMERYVHPLFALRDRKRGYEVAVMKQAMELLGRKAGPVRPPLEGLQPEEVERLRLVVEDLAEFERSAAGRG